MKKIFLAIVFFCLLSIIFIPILTEGALVECGNSGPSDCTLEKLGGVALKIYKIIVDDIAVPLATLAIIIGGILMMISAGNPNMMGTGKKVFWAAIIGLVLTLGSREIIKLILTALGSSIKI